MGLDLSYELTDQSKVNSDGVTLHRIRATRDIPSAGIAKGDLGGWVSTARLENGDARIADEAWVHGEAEVSGNALVSGNAIVFGNAVVSGNAWIFGEARVSGEAEVSGDAWISGRATVGGNAWVIDNARITDTAQVDGQAWISGEAQIHGAAEVYGNALVSGKATISENAEILDGAQISGKAEVCGEARVSGNAQISGNARISASDHYLVVGPVGSKSQFATLSRQKGGKHRLDVGCWVDIRLDALMDVVDRQREGWKADDSTQAFWVSQYAALKQLAELTAARWVEGYSEGERGNE